jgi:hypothetical protein
MARVTENHRSNDMSSAAGVGRSDPLAAKPVIWAMIALTMARSIGSNGTRLPIFDDVQYVSPPNETMRVLPAWGLDRLFCGLSLLGFIESAA